MKIKVFSDGGARGNPGPAAIGCVIQNANLKNQNDKSKCKIFEISKYIGTATNNQAEYRAVIEALNWIKENYSSSESDDMSEESPLGIRSQDRNSSRQARTISSGGLEIEFFLDSQLVVEQLNGKYKLKNEGLKPLFWQIRDLIMEIGGKVTFKHIPREQNKEADRLVNQAIDKEIGRQRDKEEE